MDELIGGSGGGAPGTARPLGPNVFIGKIGQNNRLAPPALGNSGSATETCHEWVVLFCPVQLAVLQTRLGMYFRNREKFDWDSSRDNDRTDNLNCDPVLPSEISVILFFFGEVTFCQLFI